MRILVIGSGGREHALVWKLRQSSGVRDLFCAPGNPGMEGLGHCVPIRATEIDRLAEFAAGERIDLTVVGPEQPLAEGLTDVFEQKGLMVFGPTRRAAELEWSKAFAKDFMQRHAIPTARHRTFSARQREEARTFLRECELPVVLKVDGLAAGKGVLICRTREEALQGCADILDNKAFGPAGEQLVVEEFLEGQEATVFAVCDGEAHVILASAQDHKRIFDGDRGKNTGGMGAFAPTPTVTPEILQEVQRRIIEPTLHGMSSEDRPYRGCLYVGLMLTGEGPKVVEYNCRFGDPETQVVLPLFEGDLPELLLAAAGGQLRPFRQQLPAPPSSAQAVCVVIASQGYPDSYETGMEISGLEEVGRLPGVQVFHAGTKREGDRLVTAGGRVLGVTAMRRGATLAEVIDTAYEAVGMISFRGMQYRKDIGRKALAPSPGR